MDDFRVGSWLVEPASCRLSIDGRSLHVRAKVMELLQYLACHPLEVVSKERLLDDVWAAKELSESALTRTVTELRQALGDDIAAPRFIETIPKRGYRFIAPVTPVTTLSLVPSVAGSGSPPPREPAERLERPSPHVDARAMAASGSTREKSRLRAVLATFAAVAVVAGLWSASQGDVARQVAATLARRFGTVLSVPTPAVGTAHPEAYDAYLRGLWHLKDRSTPNAVVAIRGQRRLLAVQELERALVLDPGFARAHAAMASVYTQQIFYDAPNDAQEQRAFVEIQRALALDSGLAEAYLARAQLTWSLRNGFPHDAAIADVKRALSINPDFADAYVELAKIYYHMGLLDESIAANELAQQLDPSEALPRTRRFRALIDAGRLDVVRSELDRKATLGPYVHADALLALGRPEQALQALTLSLARASGDPAADTAAVALLGVVQARLGQREAATRTIATAVPAADNPTGLSHMHHAQVHIGAALALLGRRDEAVRWLTKAADQGYPSYPRYSTDQSLAPLRGYREFDELLARLEQDWRRWQERL